MKTEITYRNVDRTPLVDDLIHDYSLKLLNTCDYITSCRIAVEKQQKHQRGGRPFRVRLDIAMPRRRELVVKKEQTGGDSREQLVTVLKEVFLIARRKLESLKEKQRRNVKQNVY